MPYTVDIARSAQRAIDTLPKTVRDRVIGAIDGLTTNPRPPGVRAMQGQEQGTYRIRVGDYRVIYTVDDGALRVLVVKVGNRRDVYR